ncbi:hypothetical protein RIF29_17902 [Crotalaria pallida]|uniref:Uncharacterized protein n=1 Tax=Crotalaria pallida TaxID=3830 RepID=A0AAN9FK95_CROPI
MLYSYVISLFTHIFSEHIYDDDDYAPCNCAFMITLFNIVTRQHKYTLNNIHTHTKVKGEAIFLVTSEQ